MKFNKFTYILPCLFILLFFSCKKDDKIITEDENIPGQKTVSGKVQKGPYKNGASLIIYELNSLLGQTGKSFASTISDDAGNFTLNNINLSSNYILISASGYYFNEHFNKVSEGQLYMEAIADVSDISTVNVNILTHIIKPRIEKLVNSGLDFNTSKTLAQNELLTLLGSNVGVTGNFETFDLSGNGFLLAVSLLFQRNNSFGWQMGYSYSAELSGLLSNFRNDFANNGLIDNQNLIDTLIYNAKRIDLIDSKNDLNNYYSGLGLSFSVSGFEQYVYNFQKKYTATFSNNICFEDSAVIMQDAPGSQPPFSYRYNILVKNKKNYYNVSQYQGQMAISAIVPYDSSLTIKITPYNSSFYFNPSSCFGWKVSNSGSTAIFEAQRKNVALSYMIGVSIDSARVEYFNNSSSSSPFYSKNVMFN